MTGVSLYYICFILSLFFFQQKTAYEMRISDCSSDVCSSDLVFGILGVVNFAHGEFYMLGAYTGLILVTNYGLPIWVALVGVLVVAIILGLGAEGLQIGRASCRERVCQYV